MIKTLFNFCWRVMTNRLGQALFVLNLILVIYTFAQKPAESDIPCQFSPASVVYLAGRMFHWTNESSLLQVIAFLDLPAMFVASIFSILSLPFGLCQNVMSWITGISILICASFQWLLIGFWIEKFSRMFKRSPKM